MSLITPLGEYIAPFNPVSNITPFTYRDGLSYLDILEGLRVYVNETLVDFVNTNFGKLGDDFESQVNLLFTQVETQLTEQGTAVTGQVDSLTTFVNDSIADIINSTIAVTDPVVKALFDDVSSETFKFLDGKFVSKNTRFVRAEDYPTFQDALDYGSSVGLDVVFSTKFTLNSGINWESNKHSIIGVGGAILDFTGMANGVAITVAGLHGMDSTQWEFRSIIHKASGFQIIGSELDATTVDGILISSDISKASHIIFENLYIKGFRDALILGDNTWCVTLDKCMIINTKRRGISFIGTINSGENFYLTGCTIANVRNSGNNGVALYTNPNALFGVINVVGTSFDYCDLIIDHNAGTIAVTNSHFENSGTQPMAYLSYTNGKALTNLFISNSVFNPAEPAPVRPSLIETRGTSGGGVRVALVANLYRLFDRDTMVFKNMSASNSPQLKIVGGSLDNAYITYVASFGQYSNVLVNGDFEGAVTLLSVKDTEGGWWKDSNLSYAIDSGTFKRGTQSMRVTGTGTVIDSDMGQTIRVGTNDTLVISAYIKSVIAAGEFTLRIEFLQGDKVTTIGGATIVGPIINASQEWKGVSQQINVPRTAVYCRILFHSHNLNGSVWIDDPIITRI